MQAQPDAVDKWVDHLLEEAKPGLNIEGLKKLSGIKRLNALKDIAGKAVEAGKLPLFVKEFQKPTAKERLATALNEFVLAQSAPPPEVKPVVTEKVTPEEFLRLLTVEFGGADSIFQDTGGYMFRNVGEPVSPNFVFDSNGGHLRVREDPPPRLDAMRRIFTDSRGANDRLEDWVRTATLNPDGVDGEGKPASGRVYGCMSWTLEPDNTQGRSPTYQYAIPPISLSPVDPAVIKKELSTSAVTLTDEQVGSQAPFTLRSNDGAIESATFIAFVSATGSQEHTFFNTITVPDGAGWRMYLGNLPHQTRFKQLKPELVARYKSFCDRYSMPY